MNKICPKCKNTQFNKGGQCLYCIWKGDDGPGKDFKMVLKIKNKHKVGNK